MASNRYNSSLIAIYDDLTKIDFHVVKPGVLPDLQCSNFARKGLFRYVCFSKEPG